jgi:hypothetical protein
MRIDRVDYEHLVPYATEKAAEWCKELKQALVWKSASSAEVDEIFYLAKEGLCRPHLPIPDAPIVSRECTVAQNALMTFEGFQKYKINHARGILVYKNLFEKWPGPGPLGMLALAANSPQIATPMDLQPLSSVEQSANVPLPDDFGLCKIPIKFLERIGHLYNMFDMKTLVPKSDYPVFRRNFQFFWRMVLREQCGLDKDLLEETRKVVEEHALEVPSA